MLDERGRGRAQPIRAALQLRLRVRLVGLVALLEAGHHVGRRLIRAADLAPQAGDAPRGRGGRDGEEGVAARERELERLGRTVVVPQAALGEPAGLLEGRQRHQRLGLQRRPPLLEHGAHRQLHLEYRDGRALHAPLPLRQLDRPGQPSALGAHRVAASAALYEQRGLLRADVLNRPTHRLGGRRGQAIIRLRRGLGQEPALTHPPL